MLMIPAETRLTFHVHGIGDLAVDPESVRLPEPPPMSRRDRIREKILSRTVEAPAPPWLDTPCRLWTGGTSGTTGRGAGYGRMNLEGGTVAPHIALWVVEHGPIPPRKQLDHLCRNRLCVVHTELVTHKQNQKRRDAAIRARVTCEPLEARA